MALLTVSCFSVIATTFIEVMDAVPDPPGLLICSILANQAGVPVTARLVLSDKFVVFSLCLSTILVEVAKIRSKL